MKKLFVILNISIAILLNACGNNKTAEKYENEDNIEYDNDYDNSYVYDEDEEDEIIEEESSGNLDPHCAQNSIDWAGTYEDKFESIIINDDLSFERHIGDTIEYGEFAWDTEGSIIALVNGYGEMALYQVEENRLIDGFGVTYVKIK